jgi:hypothetical protein
MFLLFFLFQSGWGLGEGLTTLRSKKSACYEVVEYCEYSNEPSCFIKSGEFVD